MNGTLSDRRIDKETPIPLYYQLKEILRDHISSSQPGELIPTEKELCDQFDISRPTVRQAINELVNEGYLHRSKGKGTFITEPKVRRDFLIRLESFHQEMREKGISARTKVLGLVLTHANDIVAKKLEIEMGSQVAFLRRLRFAAHYPLMYVESFVPYERVPEFEKIDFEREALHDVLKDTYGIHLERGVRALEAIASSDSIAELLEIDPGAPVHYVETEFYSARGWPIEFSTAWYRGDRSRFVIETHHEVPGSPSNS
ncbi:MAG: GntR family transcriptional regulator [Alkalispirochaeta sp.]